MGLFSKSSRKESQKTTMAKKVEPSPEPTRTITFQVKEKSDKMFFEIRNLKALEKTGTKEIRSHIFPVYIDAGTRGRDKVVHRYVPCSNVLNIDELHD